MCYTKLLLIVGLLPCLLVGLASRSVKGDFAIDLTPTGNPGNTLFQNTEGTTVTGTTKGGFLLDVKSADIPQVVFQSGGGQGQIQPLGGTGAFQSVIVEANSTTPFTWTIFDVNVDVGKDGLLTIVVDGLDAMGNSENEVFSGIAVSSGNNRIRVEASNGERISRLTYTSDPLAGPNIEQFRQLRLGGDSQAPPVAPPVTGVPEASSILVWLAASFGIALWVRKGSSFSACRQIVDCDS